MKVDIPYCASSFLLYRTVLKDGVCFSEKLPFNPTDKPEPEYMIHTSCELESAIKKQLEELCANKKVALALSGGIDSAVLAKYVPEGTKAFTFQCVVPGVEVTNEVPQAAKYAKECNLDHEIVQVTWQDMEELAPVLMKHKGAPLHSIEVQIYKASLVAKEQGYDCLIFGESADVNYAGLSSIMSRDWTFGDFVERYSYVLPYKVLKDWRMDLSYVEDYTQDNGYVDVFNYIRNIDAIESVRSYYNATETAGIDICMPYLPTWMDTQLDIERVRRGENKYLIREIFERLYPEWDIPKKIPMPRPVDQWLENWEGPTRSEFRPHCTDDMTGDEKWLVWSLETFLNCIDD